MTVRRFTGGEMVLANTRAKGSAICSLDEDALTYVAERGHIHEMSRLAPAATLLIGIELGIALVDIENECAAEVERMTGRVEI